MSKSVYIVRYDDLPCQKNRAVYQRPLFLSKKHVVNYITSAESTICNDVADRVRIISVPLSKLRRFGVVGVSLWSVFAAIYLAFRLRNLSDAVVYTFHRNGFLSSGILKIVKGKKIKLICDMQHTPFYYLDAARYSQYGWLKRFVYMFIGYLHYLVARVVLPRADLVCAMSLDYGEGFAKILEDKFYIKREALFPIPNGASISVAEKYFNGGRIVREDGSVKFLFAGNLQVERLQYIIRFFQAYQEYDLNSELILCGNLTPEARRLLSQYNSNSCISHRGILPHHELMGLYNIVDVALVTIETSRRDHKYSHPGKMYEAMGMRKVVVASDFSLAKKVITDGVNGYLIFDHRHEETASKIYNLMRNGDKSMYVSIGNRAYETAKQFDWDAINQSWYARIEKLLI